MGKSESRHMHRAHSIPGLTSPPASLQLRHYQPMKIHWAQRGEEIYTADSAQLRSAQQLFPTRLPDSPLSWHPSHAPLMSHPCPTPHAKCCAHLLDVQEVLGFKGDGHSLYRHLIPWRWIVANICPNSKSHWFGLEGTHEVDEGGGLRPSSIWLDWASSDCVVVCFVNYSLKCILNGLCGFPLLLQ